MEYYKTIFVAQFPYKSNDSLDSCGYTNDFNWRLSCNGILPVSDASIMVLFGSVAVELFSKGCES